MNSIGRYSNNDIVIFNINHILKTDYVELSYKDSLINIISTIKLEELEKIQTNIFFVIDDTGLYSIKFNLEEQVITKVYDKGGR